MELRHRRRRAKGGRQPRPHLRTDQPLIQEAIGREARQPPLPQIERRQRDQRRHDLLGRLQAAIARHQIADRLQTSVMLRLRPDARRLNQIARPAAQRILAIQPDVEAAPDIALRRRAETGELLHFRQRHRTFGRPSSASHRHTPPHVVASGDDAPGWLTPALSAPPHRTTIDHGLCRTATSMRRNDDIGRKCIVLCGNQATSQQRAGRHPAQASR